MPAPLHPLHLSHPSHPFHPSRRLLLLGLGLGIGIGLAAYPGGAVWAQAGSASKVNSRDLPAGVGALTLDFELDGEAENQLLFTTLRSTAGLASVSLIDPQQRTLWRKTASELGRVPREQTPRPELGDALTLPGVRDAARGRWRLLIERAPPFAAAGKVLVGMQLQPRFDLQLVLQTPRPATGQVVLLAVYPRDYGTPLRGLPAIELQSIDATGQRVGTAAAVEFARNSQGLAISNEAGVYWAKLSFERAGSYRVEARHVFAGRAATPRTAVLNLTVGPPAAALQLLGLRRDGPAGSCARSLVFDFAVEVATAGTYLCDLSLMSLMNPSTGGPGQHKASASAELAVGAGRISVSVAAAAVLALGHGPFRLERVALVRFSPGTPALLLERSDIKLPDQAIDTAAFCK